MVAGWGVMSCDVSHLLLIDGEICQKGRFIRACVAQLYVIQKSSNHGGFSIRRIDMPIDKKVSPDGELVTLSISGRFDISLYPDFSQALAQCQHPHTRFVIDIRNTNYIHDFGLSMLLTLRTRIGAGRIDIITTRPEVKNMLAEYGFTNMKMCA